MKLNIVIIAEDGDMKVNVYAYINCPGAYRPDMRLNRDRLTNRLHEALREHGFNASEIKILK